MMYEHFRDFAVLGSNAVLVFGLELLSFNLLFGKTSALTKNVAGPVKDWILIYLSSVLSDAPIAWLQIMKYVLAFAGVCFYNYSKYKELEVPINESNVAIFPSSIMPSIIVSESCRVWTVITQSSSSRLIIDLLGRSESSLHLRQGSHNR
eukprot:29945-Pelagococcus_subviridis.AAC.2